jgi:hypothetical protein
MKRGRSLLASISSAVFGGPVCNWPNTVVASDLAAAETVTGYKQEISLGGPIYHRARSAPAVDCVRGVKVGLKAEADHRMTHHLSGARSGRQPNHRGADFILRTTGSHRDLVANVRAAVAEVNPEIGIQFRVLTQRIKDTLLRYRLTATVSGALALLAGLLATLGAACWRISVYGLCE